MSLDRGLADLTKLIETLCLLFAEANFQHAVVPGQRVLGTGASSGRVINVCRSVMKCITILIFGVDAGAFFIFRRLSVIINKQINNYITAGALGFPN